MIPLSALPTSKCVSEFLICNFFDGRLHLHPPQKNSDSSILHGCGIYYLDPISHLVCDLSFACRTHHFPSTWLDQNFVPWYFAHAHSFGCRCADTCDHHFDARIKTAMGTAPQDCTMDISHLAVCFNYWRHHLCDALSSLSGLSRFYTNP